MYIFHGINEISDDWDMCLAKVPRAGGAPPRTDALIGPAAYGRCPKPDSFKTTCMCARRLSWISWTSLVTLPRSPTPEGRPAGTLALRPAAETDNTAWIKDCVSAVTSQNQQRNDATISTQNQHQTISEISTPRWRHATAKRANRVFQSNAWKPTWKPNQAKACLDQQKASNELSIPNSDWTGKNFDLNAEKESLGIFRDLFLVS